MFYSVWDIMDDVLLTTRVSHEIGTFRKFKITGTKVFKVDYFVKLWVLSCDAKLRDSRGEFVENNLHVEKIMC
jgi:hypothetical protein